MSPPAVTVAIPLYNKAAFIGDAVTSALAQSFADFEIVVVDDGSTDDGPTRMREISDRRLILVHQENAGVAAARNRAMAEARAPLVAFLDADDLWAPDHLLHLMKQNRRYPQAALFGNRFVEFASAHPPKTVAAPVGYALLEDYFSSCAAGQQPFFTSSCMAKRAEALALGGFPAGQSRGEDLVLWMKLSATAPVAVSSYLGCFYRRGLNSLTARPITEPDVSMTTLDELIIRHREWPSSRQRAAREYYYRIALAHALDCIRAGDEVAAARFLRLSSGTATLRSRWWQARLFAAVPRPLRNLVFHFNDQGRDIPVPTIFPGSR